eukprot:2638010-Prymnesium_polylepis.1
MGARSMRRSGRDHCLPEPWTALGGGEMGAHLGWTWGGRLGPSCMGVCVARDGAARARVDAQRGAYTPRGCHRPVRA